MDLFKNELNKSENNISFLSSEYNKILSILEEFID